MRYIDADALLAKQETLELPDPNGGEYHIDIIHANDVKRAPTADVVEVRHGEWEVWGLCNPKCSLCKNYGYAKDRYCPNCGARMDGERSENGT